MIFRNIILTILLLSSFVKANDIKLMMEIFSPYQFKDDNQKLIGISVEIVEAIEKELGNNNKIKLYPWVRGVKVLDKKKNSALFSMLRTKDREDKYKWVGPLDKMQLVFFKKKGSSIVLNNIDDARKVNKIGVTRKVANHDILSSMNFKNLDVASGNDDKNIRKLLKGRIDLWPYLKSAGLYNAKKMGKAGEIVVIPNVVLFEGDLYIAFNKKTDDKIIKKWQNALDKLVKNGTIDKIKKRY